MKYIILLFLVFVNIGYTQVAHAATINAASCSQTNVQTAINSASDGDTVTVPAGSSCSWSGLVINKAIHLKGAGKTASAITLTGTSTVTKQAAGVVRISDFNFSKTMVDWGFEINGSWLGAEPIVFQNNNIVIENGGGLMQIGIVGGLIVAGNSITAQWDDPIFQPKVGDNTSWTTADTMGTRDTDGKKNLYFENNTIYGGTNTGIDCDDATRCVYRYNTLTYSSFNSHGQDTSPIGVRHWEIYNNTWIYPSFSGNPPTEDVTNQGWVMWIRGGTGVIFNNTIPDIQSQWWGNPNEFKMSIRGAEDAIPQGSCSDVTYPVPHQLGQSHNGTSTFTDPIYIWGNVGSLAGIEGGWTWGNPCGLTWTDFYQQNRDWVSGTAKPGYTAYTYPHPLLTEGGGTPPVLASVSCSPSSVQSPSGTTSCTVSVTSGTPTSYTGSVTNCAAAQCSTPSTGNPLVYTCPFGGSCTVSVVANSADGQSNSVTTSLTSKYRKPSNLQAQ